MASKDGRTGPLCFVTVSYVLATEGETLLRETQDIVYRGVQRGAPERPTTPLPDVPVAGPAPSVDAKTVDADPVLLFRYSAVTFNGRRIHYDRRYCMEEEGYPGLVVHGPLQATMLLQFATDLEGAVPSRFTFRSESPLFDDAPFGVHAERSAGGLRLRTTNAAVR